MHTLVRLSLIAIFAATCGCQKQEQLTSNSSPLSPINGLKEYVLESDISKYRDLADRCSGLQHYSEQVEVCIFEDTLLHRETEFWLFFVQGKMARVEARAGSLITKNDIHLIQRALEKKYGKTEQGFGFLTWKDAGNTLQMRIRQFKRGWVWAENDTLAASMESYRLERPEEDI